MIVKIRGKLVGKKDHSLVLDVNGLSYDVLVAKSVSDRIDEYLDEQGCVSLTTYHYFQVGPSRGVPVLVGFLNDVEKDFFEQFITVAGIGPRAAVRALNQPISRIARAIGEGDIAFLKQLPGVGNQKAKEIVAKLQGKIGKFGLIQDRWQARPEPAGPVPDWQAEALEILLQLQYRRQEAEAMIHRALDQAGDIQSAEELLNEIYKQRIH